MQKLSSLLLKSLLIASLSMFSLHTMAEEKAYGEIEFLNAFSGKTKKTVLKALGEPDKKQMSVKPSNAKNMVAGMGKEDKSKPVKIEMWYYKGLVKYDPEHFYKETELTLVNDRVMNIGFFNNR